MLQSVFIYGVLIFVMMVLSYLSSVHRKNRYNSFISIFGILWVFLFALVSGLRYDVGVDYFSYLDSYQKVLFFNDYRNLSFEPGFTFFTFLLAKLNAHYFWFFFLTSFCQIYFIYLTFKNDRRVLIFFSFVVISSGFYFTLMNEIRQSIVICIFLYATRFIVQRNLFKYGIIFLISYSIHQSSLFFIPAYIIFRFNKDYFSNIYFQVVILLFSVYLSYFSFWSNWLVYLEQLISFIDVGDKYGGIEERISVFEHQFTRGARFFIPLIINLLIILYSSRMKKTFEGKLFTIYYNFFFIGAVSYLLFFNNILFQRPFRFFTFFQVVMSSYFLLYLWENRTKFNFIVLTSLVFLNLIVLYAFIASNHHTQYNFFWTNH